MAMGNIPLQQALADYRKLLDRVEPVLEKWWQESPQFESDDPLALLMEAYFQRWERFRKWVDAGTDADYQSLFAEINEIADWLPGMETTRPPFSRDLCESLEAGHKEAGFSEQEISTIMAYANSGERGRKRDKRIIAREAYRLFELKGKTHREVADALCDCGNHKKGYYGSNEKRLSPCADRLRDLSNQLKAVLEKYSPAD
jgi:hypothetical protein